MYRLISLCKNQTWVTAVTLTRNEWCLGLSGCHCSDKRLAINLCHPYGGPRPKIELLLYRTKVVSGSAQQLRISTDESILPSCPCAFKVMRRDPVLERFFFFFLKSSQVSWPCAFFLLWPLTKVWAGTVWTRPYQCQVPIENVPSEDFNQSEEDVGTLHFNIVGTSTVHGFTKHSLTLNILLYFHCIKA